VSHTPETPTPVLKVAISVPLARAFDYLPPAGVPVPAPGCRVRVPFGTRQRVGVVIGQSGTSDIAPERVRPCTEVLDAEPLLRNEDLRLIRFTSDYYHHPIGEVVAAALPAMLRQGKALHPVVETIVASDLAEGVDVDALAKRAPKQAELLETLYDAGGSGIEAEQLTEMLPNWRRAATGLFGKGLIERIEARAADFDESVAPPASPGPTLNREQVAALGRLRSSDTFNTFLLEGVTGSGKTEVYLQRMQDVIETGRQVLVLVPEIGLTPQLVARLRKRLGIEPAVLHSGLADTQRLAAWRAGHRVEGVRGHLRGRPAARTADHSPRCPRHEGRGADRARVPAGSTAVFRGVRDDRRAGYRHDRRR